MRQGFSDFALNRLHHRLSPAFLAYHHRSLTTSTHHYYFYYYYCTYIHTYLYITILLLNYPTVLPIDYYTHKITLSSSDYFLSLLPIVKGMRASSIYA